MATHSSGLAWRIPGMEEPGGLPSMGSHKVRHDWCNLAAAASHQGNPSHNCNLPNGKNHRHYVHSQSVCNINMCLNLNVIQTQNCKAVLPTMQCSPILRCEWFLILRHMKKSQL